MRNPIQGKSRTRSRGQGMVEFALSLPILLLLIMGVVEFARILHAFLAVENAARFAIRYAVTGEFDSQYCDEAATYLTANASPAFDYAAADLFDGVQDCVVPSSYTSAWELRSEDLQDMARLPSIRDVAKAGAAGISADHSLVSGILWDSAQANKDEYSWFYTTICSNRDADDNGTVDFVTFKPPQFVEACTPREDAGGPSDKVVVMVRFNHPLITPFISAMWPVLTLRAQREGIVEYFRLPRVENVNNELGLPTATYTITNTPTDTATPTETSTPTQTSTRTSTSTATSTEVVITCSGTGIAREVYSGIGGTSVTNLTSSANYPDAPSSTGIQSSFEAPSGVADNYGQRMRALLCVPQAGDYTFWLASDDGGSLRINTATLLNNPVGADYDSLALGVTQIASVSSWTSSRQWNKLTSQQSAPIALEPGWYYIEALMKEGGGGDNLAVSWKRNDTTDPANSNGTYIIPQANLYPPTLNPTVTPTNTNTSTVTLTSSLTPTASRTSTVTPTFTMSSTATQTFTASNTSTRTATVPTSTRTNTRTFTATVPTSTPSNTRTFTATVPTSTPSNTRTSTATVPTSTNTNTSTNTATVPTSTRTNTSTSTNTWTNTSTSTSTRTSTRTSTNTATFTASATATRTATVATNTPTITPTPTNTNTPKPGSG